MGNDEQIQYFINYGTVNFGEVHYHYNSPEPSVANSKTSDAAEPNPVNVIEPIPGNLSSAAEAIIAIEGLAFDQSILPVIEAIRLTLSSLKCKRDAIAMHRLIEERQLVRGGLSISKFCKLLTYMHAHPDVLPNRGAFKQVVISNNYPNWQVNSSSTTTARFLEVGKVFLNNMQKVTQEANHSAPDNV